MKIWITGIAGFLGSHLADELLKLGHHVSGNDNFLCGSKDNIPREVIKPFAKNYEYNFAYDGDCCTFGRQKDYFNNFKPDVLIHCAATAHEGLSNFSPSFITRNIYEASIATFSAAIAAGVKRIVFMSSMARYGNGGEYNPPFMEKDPTEPIDPYGIAKVAAEKTLKALCKLHNVEYVIIVPHNIIGTRQRYNDPFRNVASIMINRALQSKPILVYGDGQQKRCFSPINDCLHSLVQTIDAPISGEVINIGPDGGEITVLKLAEIIRELTGGLAEIQHLPARPNEVKDAWCSSDKARKLLGFNPQQNLRDCLAEMVLHIKERGTKEFDYSFPIEIEKGCPEVWLKKRL